MSNFSAGARGTWLAERHRRQGEPAPPKYPAFDVELHGSDALLTAKAIDPAKLNEDELAAITGLEDGERAMHPYPLEIELILTLHHVPDPHDEYDDEHDYMRDKA